MSLDTPPMNRSFRYHANIRSMVALDIGVDYYTLLGDKLGNAQSLSKMN